MSKFPPMEDRPCHGHGSCFREQDDCICYQETLDRTRRFKLKFMYGALGAVVGAWLWLTFFR